MKKILLAFDGQHFSTGVFDFVNHMNKHQPVLATGIFLPSIDYIELLYSYGGVPAGPLYVSEAMPGDDTIIEKNIARFVDLCEKNGIKYKVHTDLTEHVVTSVKDETRFADMLVLSSKSFYENLGEDNQEEYLANVLHKTECPVVLIPSEYKAPQSIIMAYDGSEQSVFAIKQFAYLFPEFHNKQALLVYFDKGNKGVPHREHIEELASLHFKHLTISKLKIDHKKDLEKWLNSNENTMLVTGAFGRSVFSEIFKKSFITDIISHHKVPVFVAHK